MSFSAAWLDLREPADRAARASDVTRFVAATLDARTGSTVLDLGSGTGANLRYLVDHLPGDQRWTLVDHDRRLLDTIAARMGAGRAGSAPPVPVRDGRCHVSVREHDLRTLDASLFEGVGLVTASALLDLVSESWIETLAAHCRAAGASALFVLNYDGRIECSPGDPDDHMIVALVNRHQRTDKGFGAAVGPTATSAAAHAFTTAGYGIRRARSDWRLGPDSAELQRQLVIGWAEAASAIDPSRASRVDGWRARRLTHIETGSSSMVVGHEDLGAVLPR
jgi:hypothetical protein